MNDKKEVTVWYRWNKIKNEYEFNHYSEGYNPEQTVPMSDIPKQQKDWKKAKWLKKYGHLVQRENKYPILEKE